MTHLNVDLQAINSADGPVLFVAAGSSDKELASDKPHQHARGQLFGSLRGLVTLGLDDGVWVVPAIHAVWIPPHLRHFGRSHGPFHGWSAYITEQACDNLPKNPCTLRTSGLLREAVLRASTWPLGPLDEPQTHIASIILDEIRTLPVEPLGLPLPHDPRLQQIARALIADPADDRDLEAWAHSASVSSRTLSRRFVMETGFNFTTWRQRARLMRSLEMLADGTPVTAIALDLGYATASAYIGLFKRTFGDTPAAYRARL
ncbi:helix-turn-helix domain-containing protein [Rhodoferax sp. U11-2br]|uniref:AraC family transcriptional regulator n=1 Tax=Rhodoferax sp. U11-2br TaxID=2838878 RepID=UPI001BEAE142|nr:helix-turn-helix transcriptional regulator [Rhodoferax sp. U11-2br]MBT3068013.1 helix-turn-helix transcriptional regulator [Rhodoferax sp. U11-2br]